MAYCLSTTSRITSIIRKTLAKWGQPCAHVRYDKSKSKLVISSEYDYVWVSKIRNIPGRSWNKNLEINVFPRYQRKKIWNALMEAFPGRKLLVTDCGITKEFTIPYKK